MKYLLKELARQLKSVREAKGLSQRELGERGGVPQSHVSKIEAGDVDLRLSSLLEIGRALDLEVMLVPRKLVPLVEAMSRESRPAVPASAARSLRLLRDAVAAHKPLPPALRALGETLGDLSGRPLGAEVLVWVRKALRVLRRSGPIGAKMEAIAPAAQALRVARNRLAHGVSEESPQRPAYSLDEEDDDA